MIDRTRMRRVVGLALAVVLAATLLTSCRLTSVTQVVAGSRHSCALLSDGSVRCWGANDKGQLGDQTTVDHDEPLPVHGLAGVTQLSSGDEHTCALLTDGTIQCWGDNGFAQIGTGTPGGPWLFPVEVASIDDAVQVTAGEHHSCAVLADGTGRCWGDDSDGQLGDGVARMDGQVVAVSSLTDAVAVTAGRAHTCALVADGSMRCWGSNGFGQLGIGGTDTGDQLTPQVTVGITDATQIDAGLLQTCARLGSGEVDCWGYDHGATSFAPDRIGGLPAVDEVSAGALVTCARLGDGTLRCWGDNAGGRLGDGTTTSSTTPVSVVDVTGATGVTTGDGHGCARRSDGTVQCWGTNLRGQLGNGTTGGAALTAVFVGTT